MTFTKVMFSVAAFSLGVASAASSTYNVKLNESVTVAGTQLKAGEYTVAMQGDKAVFKHGKSVIEVPATLAASEQKYNLTLVMTRDAKLREIDLGGTKSKITFDTEAPAAGTK